MVQDFSAVPCKGCPKQFKPVCSTQLYCTNRCARREGNRRHKNRNGQPFCATFEEYAILLEAQNGVCGICKTPEGPKRRFAVDHCHKTDRVRGLLCFACNTGIGKFEDDPARMREGADYVERGGV